MECVLPLTAQHGLQVEPRPLPCDHRVHQPAAQPLGPRHVQHHQPRHAHQPPQRTHQQEAADPHPVVQLGRMLYLCGRAEAVVQGR